MWVEDRGAWGVCTGPGDRDVMISDRSDCVGGRMLRLVAFAECAVTLLVECSHRYGLLGQGYYANVCPLMGAGCNWNTRPCSAPFS